MRVTVHLCTGDTVNFEGPTVTAHVGQYGELHCLREWQSPDGLYRNLVLGCFAAGQWRSWKESEVAK